MFAKIAQTNLIGCKTSRCVTPISGFWFRTSIERKTLRGSFKQQSAIAQRTSPDGIRQKTHSEKATPQQIAQKCCKPRILTTAAPMIFGLKPKPSAKSSAIGRVGIR